MSIQKRFHLTLALLFVFASQALCQDVSFPDINTLTAENLFSATIEPLYGLVIILSGYLSTWIPWLRKFTPFYRVLAFALAAGLGFSLFGFSSFWKLASTYFFSSGLYLILLKNIFASPKALPA
jgi:hypothetical protein